MYRELHTPEIGQRAGSVVRIDHQHHNRLGEVEASNPVRDGDLKTNPFERTLKYQPTVSDRLVVAAPSHQRHIVAGSM